jgi:hypothetical protein
VLCFDEVHVKKIQKMALLSEQQVWLSELPKALGKAGSEVQ